MMNPEMMQAAQKMMANMKPEDMQRMSQMAASMDPKVMESMMQNMGGPGMKVDAAQAVEQMKSMTPEQMKTGLAQAQGQMSAQKQYMYNAAEMLKNQGNAEVKQENFDEALAKYTKALENLSGHAGDDVTNLQLNLLNNTALCYLKKKSFDKALESSERALKVDPRSFKALFRRGQAKEGMGSLAEGLYDVRRAAELSPNDKAIAKELERLRAELKERGIPEEAAVNTEKHEVSAAWQSASSGSTPTTFSPPQSRSPGAVNDPGLSDQLAKAAEKIAENPDMLTQATEAMSKLTPEQMQSMMGALPPGVDAETMKSQMESLQKNPDMLKNAMESLKAIPPEERKKLLAQRYDAASGPPAGVDQAAMAKMFEGGGSEGDMMRKAAEQMSANPELTKQMSEMMMNMPPEQMQSMMEMSARMRGGPGAGWSLPRAYQRQALEAWTP